MLTLVMLACKPTY